MAVQEWKISPLTTTDLNETRVDNRDQVGESICQIIPKLGLEKTGTSNKNISNCISVSIGGNKAFAVAEAADLLIFDDKLEKVEKSLSFNHTIDFMVCSRSLLLLGLSSSEIIFINSSTFDILETRWAESEKELENGTKGNAKESRFFVNGFIHWRGDICDVLTVAVDGKIHRIQTACEPNNTLDFTRLEKTNTDSDGFIPGSHTWKTISQNVKITASHFFSPNFVVLADQCSCQISLLELIDESTEEFICRGDQISDLLKDLAIRKPGVTIKKLVRCEGLLFVLLSTGQLEMLFEDSFFPTHALKLPIKNGFVHDFEVVLSGEQVKLWTIYCSQDHSDQAYLGVFSGPSFQSELVLAVPSTPCPSPRQLKGNTQCNDNVSSIRFNQQSSYFDEPSLFTIVTSNEIRIFQVLESSTDMTLQRLLAQGKFNLAIALSQKYSINMDVVKKAKVQAYFKDLLNTTKTEKMEQIFQLIMSTLESIEDDHDFVCTFCICDHENLLPRIDWVQKVLNLGLKRVHKVDDKFGSPLLLTNKKFYTFQQVMPTGSIHDWREFCHPANSMFDVCHRFLQNGQYEYCNSVWTRHSEEFIQDLDLGTLGTVFWALFNQQLKTSECVLLFTTVLDDTLTKCVVAEVSAADGQQEQQNKLNGMLDLVKNQICFMEREKNWPHEAVKFVETLIKIFQDEERKYEGLIKYEHLIEPEWEQKLVLCQKSINLLKFLLQALMELVELKTSHAMRVPFTKFIQEDLVDVVNALFDELFVRQEITSFITKFLKPFAARKELNLDLLYQKHIESVLQYLPYFTNTSEIPYAERLFCLVELTTNMKIKLESLFLMVQIWPVPWSSRLESLVTRTLEMHNNGSGDKMDDHTCQRLRESIALVKKQVPYQCILNKYLLTASKLTTTTGIIMGLKRILQSKKPNCDEDALELVKHTGKFDQEFVQTFKERLAMLPPLIIDDVSPSTPTAASKEDSDSTPVDLSKSVLIKLKDRCLASIKSSQTSGNIYSKEYLENQSKKAEMLSHKLNDTRAIEFLNLRKLVETLEDETILYTTDYPFSVLELMLDNIHGRPSQEIVKECSKLSTVSFYPLVEILVAVVIAFVSMPRVSTSIIQKIWEILMEIVAIPSTLRSSLLQEHLETSLHILIMRNPDASNEQQVLLEKFIIMLIESFESSDPRFSRAYAMQRIFMSLREREIPLEKNFLSIYRVICGHESKSLQSLEEELIIMGQELIRYGEHDLMVTIMNALLLEYEGYLVDNPTTKDQMTRIIDKLTKLKLKLVETSFSYKENEPSQHVLKLVTSLCEAGIFVNAFSLRSRNKTTLINKLLDIKEYRLASEVALVFKFWGKEQWSSILRGLMNQGNIQNLQSLLTNLKKVTELWVLPEFAAAWLKVSDHNPSFKRLCPIPLV